MWNSRMVGCAQAYPSAVLSVVGADGYPISVRCRVVFDEAHEFVVISGAGAVALGPACLLFHRHAEDMSGQHQLLLTGALEQVDEKIVLRPTGFLSGSGREDTDRMPGAGSVLDILRFMILGRRKARVYLAKRGKPWPPVPYKKMLAYLDKPEAGQGEN